MKSNPYNPGLHRIAIAVAVATFPLIFIGGLVTSHQAGLAVPDWPNSFGYNMFLFPPRLWVGGILFEHTHRLWASVVGMISIVLCVWAWRTPTSRRERWLATAVLGLVILQGILGGLRVVFVNLDLAMVHACVAQAFFCFAALFAVMTGRWWRNAEGRSDEADGAAGGRLVFAAGITAAIVYLQIVAGVIMRQDQAGLAIPTLPLAYGHWMAPTTADELAGINGQRAWTMNLPPVTLWQIWLNYVHRLGAIAVSAAVLGLALHIGLFHRKQKRLAWMAGVIVGLLVVQFALGVATIYYRKPADVASAHVAFGGLLMMSCFVLTACAIRLYWPRRQTEAAPMKSALAPAL